MKLDQMERTSQVHAYQEILAGITAVNQLRDAILAVRDGYGIAIPTNATQYTAKIHFWLLEHKEMLEEELGIAATMDEYGEPLQEAGK